ncbi:protein of unknown function [Neorhodopirellula lusitana]|uniref:3-keto-alpha-glucoside-1,2-lyase/3-keto-2-hydroxy-glucal hydratase domain-containing protein n=1 Tax=Neorhodopirellula lusitana TaxID=445327 RepID=A0ABY1PVV2_9BACT|nr:family 16 glycoside hydrolase [Neorhodopirellula lusitana]SMP43755.1 protein of unknown function [Neorhodopirellula lusitana]
MYRLFCIAMLLASCFATSANARDNSSATPRDGDKPSVSDPPLQESSRNRTAVRGKSDHGNEGGKVKGGSVRMAKEPKQAVLFQDDYEGRAEPGEKYFVPQRMLDGWHVVDGVLIGDQVCDDHGSVIRTDVPFNDVEIEFDFQFNGGSRFNLVIDDDDEKSVHAGHLCRVSVSKKDLKISDDKTGGMNLEIRKRRQDPSLSVDAKATLEKRLAATQSNVPVQVQPGQWHTLRVRIKGDRMSALLDGKLSASLQSPGIDHATKKELGFTVIGGKVSFDNLKVVKRSLSAN